VWLCSYGLLQSISALIPLIPTSLVSLCGLALIAFDFAARFSFLGLLGQFSAGSGTLPRHPFIPTVFILWHDRTLISVRALLCVPVHIQYFLT